MTRFNKRLWERELVPDSIALAALLILLGLAVTILIWRDANPFILSKWQMMSCYWVPVGLYVTLLCVVHPWPMAQLSRRLNHRRTRRRDTDRCVHCNYDFAQVASDRCPECGYWDPARARPERSGQRGSDVPDSARNSS